MQHTYEGSRCYRKSLGLYRSIISTEISLTNRNNMKFTPSVVFDAPCYYVDHFNGKHDIDKYTSLRDMQLESDEFAMPASLKHLTKPTQVLDLTNNELRELPNLKNRNDIHTLLLGRNRIIRIDGARLPPNLHNLVLADNSLKKMSDLQGFRGAPKSLRNLTLRGNQICHLEGYRKEVLHILPQLEVLDFSQVGKDEKLKSKNLKGKSLVKETEVETYTEEPDTRDKNMDLMNLVVSKMSDEERNKIKKQLSEASSLDEIIRLENLLSGGV